MPLITLSEGEQEELESLVKDSYGQKISVRADIILLAQDYDSIREMCRKVGDCDPRTVGKWLKRYKDGGIGGLKDARRKGGQNRISAEKRSAIIESTLSEHPDKGEKWATRSMATKHGVSRSTIQRIWYEEGIRRRKRKRSRLLRKPDG